MTRYKNMIRYRLFALAIGILATTPIATAVAAPKPAAEELIKQGIELRRAGRDLDAISKFEQAYEIAKSPRAAAQLGLCLQAVARWAEADPRLSEALTDTQDPWVKKNRETLKDALEQVKSHVGRIEVLGQPPGAEVAVNGRVIGALPLAKPILVNEGAVDIEVTAKGYRPGLKTLNMPGASFQSLVFRLDRESAPPAAAPLPLASQSEENPETMLAATANQEATDTTSRPILKSPWFWAGAAAVVGGVVLGIVLATSRSPTDPKFDDQITFE